MAARILCAFAAILVEGIRGYASPS